MDAASALLRLIEAADDAVGALQATQLPDQELRLMGMGEVADYLGLTPTTAANWRRRGKLPEPVAELACGPIWLAKQIEGLEKA